MKIDLPVEEIKQKCEKYIEENKDVTDGAHCVVACSCCGKLQCIAVFRFRCPMRPGPIKKHFPDAMLIPLINIEPCETNTGGLPSSKASLKRKALQDLLISGMASDIDRVAGGVSKEPELQDQPALIAAAGVSVALRHGPVAVATAHEEAVVDVDNTETTVVRHMAELKAMMVQSFVELKAEVERARAEGKAEAERVRAEGKAEAERTRVESKSAIERLQLELDDARTQAKRAHVELQQQLAASGGRTSVCGNTWRVRVVLDHIKAHYSAFSEHTSPPAALGLQDVQSSGSFTVRHCESLLVEWQPNIKNSDARAREVFRLVTHGRFLPPTGERGKDHAVEVFLAGGAVAFYNGTDRRGAKWERGFTGEWRATVRI